MRGYHLILIQELLSSREGILIMMPKVYLLLFNFIERHNLIQLNTIEFIRQLDLISPQEGY